MTKQKEQLYEAIGDFFLIKKCQYVEKVSSTIEEPHVPPTFDLPSAASQSISLKVVAKVVDFTVKLTMFSFSWLPNDLMSEVSESL